MILRRLTLLALLACSSGWATPLFEGQDKLKLVTHCRNHDRGERDLLEEYAAYRIFNAISDKSYRVRLLRISYQDPDRALDEKAALVFIFEYLIGNTDWGFVKAPYDAGCCHNGDLIDIGDVVYYVPYDFDLAGLVNARYAYPDPLFHIDRVTQRLYRGVCIDADVLRGALRKIRAREAEILHVMRETPGLSEDSINTGTRYLKAFFKKAGSEEKLLRSFERRCL